MILPIAFVAVDADVDEAVHLSITNASGMGILEEKDDSSKQNERLLKKCVRFYR